MADNRFGKRIKLLNNKKVCPYINTKSYEFLRKMIALNILLLWSYKVTVL